MAMKRILTLVTSAVSAVWLIIPVLAADKPIPYTDSAAVRATNYDRVSGRERIGRTQKADDVIGMEVKNLQNVGLGKVKELAVDLESGRIVAAILSTGGVLGIGNKHVAVPSRALQWNADGKSLLLNSDKERLKAAPDIDLSKWSDAWQEPRVIEMYRTYGEEPYFTGVQRTGESPDGIAARNVREAAPRERDTDAAARNTRDALRVTTTSTPAHLGHVEKASKVIGMSVKNLQDEKLGKVDNLLVDLASGRIVQVIVSSGGFLGLGDELSAVPPAAFRFNTERDEVRLDVTKDALAKAPHFKKTDWPNVDDPVYVEGVYRAYRVEPYFSTNATADADNTSRNVRDRSDRTLTPLDQGSSDADVGLSRRIRKDILAREGLSSNARNVKIITINGRVTLRGPVKTEEEKRLLGEIATGLTGAGSVDNQIEVERK